jgi:4-hydroxyphenylpyruvate dioxygenase
MLLVNREPGPFAREFTAAARPLHLRDGLAESDAARRRLTGHGGRAGAPGRPEGDLRATASPVPAMFGIGDSLIYFVDGYSAADAGCAGLRAAHPPEVVADKGFTRIDHLTNNVAKGEPWQVGSFYKTCSASRGSLLRHPRRSRRA